MTTRPHPDDPSSLWRQRGSMLLVTLLYPAWGLLYRVVLGEGAYDPLAQRLIVSLVAFAFVALTFRAGLTSLTRGRAFLATVLIVSTHTLFLVLRNDVSLPYSLGAYCVMFCAGALLMSYSYLAVYFALAAAATLYIWLHRGDAAGLFLLLGALTTMAVSYVTTFAILTTLRSLQLSRADLARRNGELKTVMESLDEGFFSFGPDGLCRETYSTACLRLLGCTPAGLPAWRALGLDDKQTREFREWMDLAFTCAPETRATVLTLSVDRVAHRENLVVTIEYRAVVDDQDRVTELVVVARDRTREVASRELARREQARLRMIATVVEQKATLHPFVADLRAQLDGYRAGGAREEFLRFLHTTKGGFGAFAMDDLVRFTHYLESEWASEPNLVPSERIRADAGRMTVALTAWQADIERVIGGSFHDERRIEVPVSHALRWLATLPKNELRAELTAYVQRPASALLGCYGDMARSLAERQGKRLAALTVEGGDLPLFPEPYQALFATMVHVFRNAVDHGLETPEARTAAGKPAAGTIRVEFAVNDGQLEIHVADDGGGIDPRRLRESLGRRGLVDARDDERILDVIFDPAFTTRAQVTELSGRGVGLSAVKAAALELGGSVAVRSRPGEGTVISVRVPVFEPSLPAARRGA